MTDAIFPVPPGPLGSWGASVWGSSVAEYFSLYAVCVDLRSDAISFYLSGEGDEYTPTGPWELRFDGVTAFDITRILTVSDPGYVRTTIADAPHYALFTREMDVHVTAAASSVSDSFVEPAADEGEALAWEASSDQGRLMLPLGSDPGAEPLFPWEFAADLFHFSLRTRALAVRLTRSAGDGDDVPTSPTGWLTFEGVVSLVMVSRADQSGRDGGYIEDIPTDGRTFYIRHLKALVVVTVG